MSSKIASEPGFYAGQFRKAGQGYVTDEVELADMTKDQLLAEATLRGLDVKPAASKAEILAALAAA